MMKEKLNCQQKQSQWKVQWERFSDEEKFLFEDWIYPNRLTDFEGKTVLECGCGGGQHTSYVAANCSRITAVDLNSLEVAVKRNAEAGNVEFVEDDIAVMNLGQKFDVAFSIGVVHHTDDPDQTVANIKRHLRPGGRLILWVYSKEGNWIAANLVERFRQRFLDGSSINLLTGLSRMLTAAMYVPIYSIYLMPFRWLPYYQYFQNFRKLGFERNMLNVFDKLNAPQVEFITKTRVESWFPSSEFCSVHIEHYKGVSWRASGTLRAD